MELVIVRAVIIPDLFFIIHDHADISISGKGQGGTAGKR